MFLQKEKLKISLTVLFILYANFLFSQNDIKDFIGKAEKIKNEISIFEKKYKKANENYINYINKIEKTKNEINSVLGFKKRLKYFLLYYYLYRGNKIAYKIEVLKSKLKELNDDYFIYVVFIIDEYNKKINNCILQACSKKDLNKIYMDREKWVEYIKYYEEFINLDDLTDVKIIKNKFEKEDLNKYYEKKLIQINQIILIFDEEKEIREKLIKYGIFAAKKEIIEKHIQDLNEQRKKIEKILFK